MSTSKDLIRNIAKSLTSAVSYAFTSEDMRKALTNNISGLKEITDAHPTAKLLLKVTGSLANAVAPNFLAEQLSALSYSKLRNALNNPDANDMNHDLVKLIKKSSMEALRLVKRMYEEKLKAEFRDSEGKAINKVFEELQKELEWVCENDSDKVLNSTINENAEWINHFTDQIFAFTHTDERGELAKYILEKMPFCLDLAMKEALKDSKNERAFKSYQMWVFEGIIENNKLSNQSLIAIEKELATVKSILLEDGKLNSAGEKFYSELLDEIKKLNGKFDEMLFIINKIDEKLTSVKSTVEEIAQNVSSLKEINTPKPIDRLLTNPPYNSDYFIGRDDDLKAIDEMIQTGNKCLVLVNGQGGIGKTTLAAKYWIKHQSRYKHLAWLYADSGVASAFITLEEALNVTFAPTDKQEEQLSRIIHALANLDAPVLIVLDNANDSDDLKKHYGILHQLPNCNVVLTSRVNSLQLIPVYQVKPLSKEDAEVLFRKYADVKEKEITLLQEILKAVEYNTLVIELLSKNLACFKYVHNYNLADLLNDLQQKGILGVKEKTIELVYGTPELRKATASEVIEAMFDLTKLSEHESYLLSNLSVLPAENISFSMLVNLLSADENELEETLSSLEEKGLVEYRKEDNSFKISPVVQEVVRKKNAEQLLNDIQVLVNNLTSGLDEGHRNINNYQSAHFLAKHGSNIINYRHLPDNSSEILGFNIGDFLIGPLSTSKVLFFEKLYNIIMLSGFDQPKNIFLLGNLAITYSKLGRRIVVLEIFPIR